MPWFGADPRGIENFGVAALHADGSFETWCCSSVDEDLQLIGGAQAEGIGCSCGGHQPLAVTREF
jgi:hypothetical protein